MQQLPHNACKQIMTMAHLLRAKMEGCLKLSMERKYAIQVKVVWIRDKG